MSDSGGTLLLLDWENLGLSRRRSQVLWQAIDAGSIDVLRDDVWVVGSEQVTEEVERWLHRIGVHCQRLPYIAAGDQIKNGADIALTVLAVDHVVQNRCSRIVLGSGDFDFRPLLRYLRDRGVPTGLVFRAAQPPNTLLTELVESAVPIATGADAAGVGRQAVRHTGTTSPSPSADRVLASLCPRDATIARTRLARAGELAEGGALTLDSLEDVLRGAGDRLALAVEALTVNNDLAPRGPMVRVATERPATDVSRAWERWVEEAVTVWVAHAIDAVVGDAEDGPFRAAVYRAAVRVIGDDELVADAWARIDRRRSRKPFVDRARGAGVSAPLDASVRREALYAVRHWHRSHGLPDRLRPDRARSDLAELDRVLGAAGLRLGVADVRTLTDVLTDPMVTAVPSDTVDAVWVTAADAAWLARVWLSASGETPQEPEATQAIAARAMKDIERSFMRNAPASDLAEVGELVTDLVRRALTERARGQAAASP